MKKTFILSLILSLSFFAFALTPDKVIFGTGNDLFSMGMSRNDDDQLSFSLNSEVAFGTKTITVDYDSVTNRGWKDGWSIYNESETSSEDHYSGRFDELKILAFHQFDFENDRYTVSVRPGLGVDFTGNLGSQTLQNILHEKISIHTVSIDYDFTTAVVRPVFAMDAAIKVGEKNQNIGACVQFVTVPTMRSWEAVWLGSSIYGFDFSLGYRFAQSWSDSKTDELYAEYMDGLVLKFGLDGGAVVVKYTSCLSTGFGFGLIGLDFVSLFDKTKSDSPLSYSVGIKREFGKKFKLVEVDYRVNERFSVVVSDSFIAGEPENAAEEKQADLTTTPRVKWNNAFILGGVKFRFDWKIVTPYISALAGVYKTENTKLFTTVTASTVPCETLEKKLYPCADLRCGLQRQILNNLGVDLFAGVSLVSSSGLSAIPYYGLAITSR